jgi:hypothetical protein
MLTLTYKVFKTINGLHLFVFNLMGNVAYSRAYPDNDGSLVKAIDLLEAGATPFTWGHNSSNPSADYIAVLRPSNHFAIIADNDGIYFDKMRKFGHQEFDRINLPPAFSFNATHQVHYSS